MTAEQINVVQTRFDPRNVTDVTGELTDPGEMVLRLRASLKSANMDNTQQSMKVTVIEEDGGKVIVDGSTEDHDERSVHLDSVALSNTTAYLIKYEFFEKNAKVSNHDDRIISASHMGASACSRPFVVAELVIQSKKLIQRRVSDYAKKERSSHHVPEEDISELHCDFSALDNSKADTQHGEKGLYCTRGAYTYSLAG